MTEPAGVSREEILAWYAGANATRVWSVQQLAERIWRNRGGEGVYDGAPRNRNETPLVVANHLRPQLYELCAEGILCSAVGGKATKIGVAFNGPVSGVRYYGRTDSADRIRADHVGRCHAMRPAAATGFLHLSDRRRINPSVASGCGPPGSSSAVDRRDRRVHARLSAAEQIVDHQRVMTSPGSTAGTPGGYGLIVSALIRPTAPPRGDLLDVGEERFARGERLVEFQFAGVRNHAETVGHGREISPVRAAGTRPRWSSTERHKPQSSIRTRCSLDDLRGVPSKKRGARVSDVARR